jgi:PAS domain S-box-containing protein
LARIYTWATSSLLRVTAAGLLLTATLIVLGLYASPVVFGASSVALILGLGYAAYRVRQSMAALDFPGIDRFFQQVPCYLTIQNKDMRIMRSNRLFRRDFGDRQGELCYRAYKGAGEMCPNCPVIRTFADGQTHSAEETVRTKDGQLANMIVYTTPVTDEQGEVVGVMEMSTNITEIKKLQDEIAASQKEYRDLFERVPCYLSILDRDLRIVRVNQQFRDEFGDSTGEYCYSVYHRRHEICSECLVVDTFNDGRIHSNEKTVIKPDGSEARLIVYSSPIYNEDGKLTAVMEMATDITEVKRLQRELTYMGKTIAVMAHRIKNILMGLEGGIFVVNTGMDDDDQAMIKQGWEMIERNVKRVSQIVKDLLYCSKEREMKFEQIDPAPVVRSVYELFEGRGRQQNVDLKLDLPDSMAVGRFDSDALHSLLTNLVTNALDACINDDTEGKESHSILIKGSVDDRGNFVFEVADDGRGIPGASVESIFDDFYSTKGREGTGLGLLVAQKVAEQHNGRITFQSKEGLGTSFRAIFPPNRLPEQAERK